jgi:hypothetical protein
MGDLRGTVNSFATAPVGMATALVDVDVFDAAAC